MYKYIYICMCIYVYIYICIYIYVYMIILRGFANLTLRYIGRAGAPQKNMQSTSSKLCQMKAITKVVPCATKDVVDVT